MEGCQRPERAYFISTELYIIERGVMLLVSTP